MSCRSCLWWINLRSRGPSSSPLSFDVLPWGQLHQGTFIYAYRVQIVPHRSPSRTVSSTLQLQQALSSCTRTSSNVLPRDTSPRRPHTTCTALCSASNLVYKLTHVERKLHMWLPMRAETTNDRIIRITALGQWSWWVRSLSIIKTTRPLIASGWLFFREQVGGCWFSSKPIGNSASSLRRRIQLFCINNTMISACNNWNG